MFALLPRVCNRRARLVTGRRGATLVTKQRQWRLARAQSSSRSPVVADTKPIRVDLQQDKSYYWCACGLSKKQPFCDGSHQGTGIGPLEFTVEKSSKKSLCACKATASPPFCDGAHRRVAVVSDTKPVKVDLNTDETSYWCSCGRSSNQPFCDGSHKGTSFKPLEFKPTETTAALCLCKQTASPPYCDGSHSALSQPVDAAATEIRWYKVADLSDLKDRETVQVQAGSKTIALTKIGDRIGALDNACPHQGGPLSEGTLSCDSGSCVLQCPWHGWEFDSITGESKSGEGAAVTSYEVKVEDGEVHVAVEESSTYEPTVSDAMVDTMQAWGITHVFGMVGHSNLGLAEAIRRKSGEEADALRFISVRHEGAAAFACSGYAKLTSTPAACLTIAGPGATNLLTGLWDAHVDRAPVIALTGQVQTQVLGPGTFQEVDLGAAFGAVAPFSQTVLSESQHRELMALAAKKAILDRSISHLIFPDEVQVLPAGDAVGPKADRRGPTGRMGDRQITPSSSSLDAAVSLLQKSSRPAVIVGYGAVGHMDAAVALAEQLGAPVLTTFKAKGQIPDTHHLAAGVLGRSGTPVASWAMSQADCLLVLGATFSPHTGIAPDIPTIQVDFDNMALGKYHPVEVPVWGEIGTTSKILQEKLVGCEFAARQELPRELVERWESWRQEKQRRREKDRGKGMASATVFEILSRHIPCRSVISVDVGNNTYSFGRYFESKQQQRVLMSGYLGSIGFGLPAAIGAWAATQAKPEYKGWSVYSVSGDGGFGQYMGEWTTAVKYNMNIRHVLLNNKELGKISKEQRAGDWPVWETNLVNPSFAEFSRLCGGHGFTVQSAAELQAALEAADALEGPVMIEVLADPELV